MARERISRKIDRNPADAATTALRRLYAVSCGKAMAAYRPMMARTARISMMPAPDWALLLDTRLSFRVNRWFRPPVVVRGRKGGRAFFARGPMGRDGARQRAAVVGDLRDLRVPVDLTLAVSVLAPLTVR